MITIGITGGYATGKTTVAKIFKKLGAKVVYADRIARSVIKPKTPTWKKLIKCFGKEIIRKNGFVNRKKLARIVFNDPIKLRKLNKLLHPQIIREIKQIIRRTKDKVLVIDAPLLFEAKIQKLFCKIIVVNCRKNIQKERALKRNRVSSEQIFQRIKSQWPLRKKIKKAHYIIDNSSSVAETKKQVKRIWRTIENSV